MATIKACCICLATDTKLTEICDSGLDYVLYRFSGIQLTARDVLHHMCTFCSALLLKCAAFRDKCLKIKETPNFFVNSCDMLANGDLLTIQLTNDLLHPYTITENNNIIDIKYAPEIKCEEADFDGELKYETDFDNDIDISDDEPLSKKATDKCKREADVKTEPAEQTDGHLKLKPVKRKKKKLKKSKSIADDGVCRSDDEVKEVLLTREQQLEEIEKRKCSKNYLQSLYQCQTCYKGFISEATYEKHVIKHDPCSGEFVCDVCRVRFPKRSGLRSHYTNVHERHYVCKRCGHVSKSRTKAKEHTKWHEGFTYNCEMCPASFSKATTYFSHLRARHAVELQCACGARFHRAAGLRMHRSRAQCEGTADYSCGKCGLRFKNELALRKHGGGADGCGPRACIQCGDSFATDALLLEHTSQHAGAQGGSYSCADCSRVFTKEITYRIHFQTVHLGVARARPAASAGVCERCGGTFSSKASLTAHLRTHTGEKPFKCSFCEKRFGTIHLLYIHRRIHTGERPYPCPACPKAFRHKAALNRHVRVHTGAKPYACSTCDKRFSQSNSAKSHIALVHMKRPAKQKTRPKEL